MSLMPLHCMLLRVRHTFFRYFSKLHHFNTHYFFLALAAASCLRSLAGYGFPLFAPAMFNKLGYGKGSTILACLAILSGCPTYVPSHSPVACLHTYFFFIIITKNSPIVLWKYGRRIRMSSKYADKSLEQQTSKNNKVEGFQPQWRTAEKGDFNNNIPVQLERTSQWL